MLESSAMVDGSDDDTWSAVGGLVCCSGSRCETAGGGGEMW